MPALGKIKRGIKFGLYYTGSYNSMRKKNIAFSAVSVIGFHRVLAASDPRWKVCFPEYGITDSMFRECIRFFKKEFKIISMEELLEAKRTKSQLPNRALVITFDDGWADTFDTAAPILKEEGVAGHIFIASSAIDSIRGFWEEQVYSSWNLGLLSMEEWLTFNEELKSTFNEQSKNVESDYILPETPRFTIFDTLALLYKLKLEDRKPLLSKLPLESTDLAVRQMVSRNYLEVLSDDNISIGAHGYTHEPLTKLDDPLSDINKGLEVLKSIFGERMLPTLALPHGDFDDRVLKACTMADIEMVFCSNSFCNEFTRNPAIVSSDKLVGRIWPGLHWSQEQFSNLEDSDLWKGIEKFQFSPITAADIMFRSTQSRVVSW